MTSASGASAIPLQFAIDTTAFAGLLKQAIDSSFANTNALQGGAGTAAFFSNLASVSDFYTDVANGTLTWFDSTLESNGYPVTYLMQESNDEQQSISLTIEPYIDLQRIEQLADNLTPNLVGAATATGDSNGGFNFNGKEYNVIGTVTVNLNYEESPGWHVMLPVGLVTAGINTAILKGIVWPNLLKPLILGVKKMVQSLIQRCRTMFQDGEDLELVAQGAANDGSIWDDPVEDVVADDAAEFSLGLGVGGALAMGLFIAIPFVLTAIEHDTYHFLRVYNLTPYNLTWDLAYFSNGALTVGPKNATPPPDLNQLIPASRDVAPKGVTPQMASQFADFNFHSTSTLTGLGYVMTFMLTDPQSQQVMSSGNVLFDIPFSAPPFTDKKNSLFVQQAATLAPQDWWNKYQGKSQVDQYVARDQAVEVTATFDFLQGKHPLPGPNGQDAYTYNSLLVFALPS